MGVVHIDINEVPPSGAGLPTVGSAISPSGLKLGSSSSAMWCLSSR
jgi:hypothetical protein